MLLSAFYGKVPVESSERWQQLPALWDPFPVVAVKRGRGGFLLYKPKIGLFFPVSSSVTLKSTTNNEIVAMAFDSRKRVGGESPEKWTFVLVLGD